MTSRTNVVWVLALARAGTSMLRKSKRAALGRTRPLEIYGPPGVRNMSEHVLAAWQDEGLAPPVSVHEIASGVVYRDSRITVTASAGGYRLQTADRVNSARLPRERGPVF